MSLPVAVSKLLQTNLLAVSSTVARVFSVPSGKQSTYKKGLMNVCVFTFMYFSFQRRFGGWPNSQELTHITPDIHNIYCSLVENFAHKPVIRIANTFIKNDYYNQALLCELFDPFMPMRPTGQLRRSDNIFNITFFCQTASTALKALKVVAQKILVHSHLCSREPYLIFCTHMVCITYYVMWK